MITYKLGKQPHPREHRLIFKNVDREGWDVSIGTYMNDGGYEDLKKAFTMAPKDITEEVKKSGLRGRGGAGFPTGVKWTFIPPNNTKPVYLICNGDESEPGTFKDRYILHQDPHQLIEGMVISCFAVGAHTAYIYIREEFPEAALIVERAIEEARAHNFLGKNVLGSGFDVEIYVHRGAGAYICGEETGLIESLEGKRPYPRIKPPYFPAALGLYMCPTIVNNVESLCHVKHIVRMGGEEYAKLGVARNTGTRILCISGDVKNPGYFEVEVGKLTMREVIYDLCGGPKDGREIKAVIPGGSSSKILRCDEVFKIKNPDGSVRDLPFWDIQMDFDTLAACGSMAGSGGVIVIDDSRKMSWVLNNLNAFYAHESCGQCTPCREGSTWMRKISDRLVAGEATPKDIETLESVAYQIDGRTICAFGEASSWPVEAIIAKFRDELISDTVPEIEGDALNPEAEAQRRYCKPSEALHPVPKTWPQLTALVIRVLLGAWFMYSGGGKIFVTGLDRFTRDVANYKLVTAPLDAVVAYTVPWVEVIGGICLMLGILRKGTLLAMSGLVLTFCTAIGWAWSKNLDISCGCHGGDTKLNYGWKAAELAGYLIAFGFLWVMEKRHLRK